MQFTSSPRIPVYNGTAAAMGTLTGMIAGDLFYTTDTKLLYTYDGATWNNVLSGVTQDFVKIGTMTFSSDSTKSISSISGYNYLMLVFHLTAIGGSSDVALTFNDDAGANYYYVDLTAPGTWAEHAGASSIKLSVGGGTNNSTAGSSMIGVKALSSSNRHTVASCCGGYQNANIDAHWDNASDITKITIASSGGNTLTGTATLFGLKN